jgi:nitrate/TMAO reductase-like tetraheme cytochrome c subunit
MARRKISLGGFVDPIRRPRWIIWTIVVVALIVGVMIPVLGITSTRWFCTNGCHKVQDDTIEAYTHSSHSEISCMACHMPVNANPVIFLMHKAEALGELAQTVTNNYELPLNGDDEVALTMSSDQCTQCHDESKRHVTPDPGLKINHQVHADNGINCTICHNRIAHKEDFQPKLVDPKSQKTNHKHVDFMTMTACFRCHSQETGKGAPPGDCTVCHTEDFNLLPASHADPGFFPKGHGQLALAEEKRAPWMNATETVSPGSEGGASGKDKYAGENLKKVDEINLCSTCHQKQFCTDCHGVPMPHPDPKIWDQNHGAIGRANPAICQKCHGYSDFCGNCHHGTHIGYKMDPTQTWKQQHPLAVNQIGASGCLQTPGTGCHSPTYCALCHANGGNLPRNAPDF